MNSHRRFFSWLAQLALVWLLTSPGAQAAAPLPGGGPPNNAIGTAITYQGHLKQSGSPITAVCDMAFRLYDAAQAGLLAANPITTTVPVTNGLFTVGLDFGAAAFTGDARFLEIRTRCPAGSGSYTLLSPRTTLAATPTALTLRSGAVISGTANTMLTINSLQTDLGLALQVTAEDTGIDINVAGQYGRWRRAQMGTASMGSEVKLASMDSARPAPASPADPPPARPCSSRAMRAKPATTAAW